MHTISKRLYDLAWEAADQACRSQAQEGDEVGLKFSPEDNFNLAIMTANDFLLKHRVKKARWRVARQIAFKLTAARIGDYVKSVTIVDED